MYAIFSNHIYNLPAVSEVPYKQQYMPHVFLWAINGKFTKKKETELEHKGTDETKHWI
jgi:hypothetical protein